MKNKNVFPITGLNQDGKNRCANCGKPIEEAKEVLTARMYDGEWTCSKECDDEHEELGCPFEHGILYRDMKY